MAIVNFNVHVRRDLAFRLFFILGVAFLLTSLVIYSLVRDIRLRWHSFEFDRFSGTLGQSLLRLIVAWRERNVFSNLFWDLNSWS